MPCHLPATIVSSRRRALYQKRPSTPRAKLDLSKLGEAWAEDYIRRACSGRSAMWHLLDLRRDESALRVAVHWIQSDGQGLFSVVTLSLIEVELHWKNFDSETAARKALDDEPEEEGGITLSSDESTPKGR